MIDPDITLRREEEYWVAIDTETGVGAQGATRAEALAELDDAVALRSGKREETVEDEDAVLRDLGIDPETVEPTEDLPEFLQ
jgi:predicted RNase H-like HicB family nuclease